MTTPPMLASIAHHICNDVKKTATSVATARRGDPLIGAAAAASRSPDAAAFDARSATQAANHTLSASTASCTISYTTTDELIAKRPKAP
ncbi:hypothetical protein D9M68_869390 [compost metagenome]